MTTIASVGLKAMSPTEKFSLDYKEALLLSGDEDNNNNNDNNNNSNNNNLKFTEIQGKNKIKQRFLHQRQQQNHALLY